MEAGFSAAAGRQSNFERPVKGGGGNLGKGDNPPQARRECRRCDPSDRFAAREDTGARRCMIAFDRQDDEEPLREWR